MEPCHKHPIQSENYRSLSVYIGFLHSSSPSSSLSPSIHFSLSLILSSPLTIPPSSLPPFLSHYRSCSLCLCLCRRLLTISLLTISLLTTLPYIASMPSHFPPSYPAGLIPSLFGCTVLEQDPSSSNVVDLNYELYFHY